MRTVLALDLRVKWIVRITPYLVLVLAAVLVAEELRHFPPMQILSTFARYSWSGFAAALGLMSLSYLCWSFYDWIGLRQLGLKVPYVQIFRTTSVAFPITNMAGYSLITGIPLRLKNYAPYKVSVGHIGQVILFNIESWWLGFLFLCGTALIESPIGGQYFSLSRPEIRWLGIGFLCIVFIYLAGCLKMHGRTIRFRNFEIHFPNLGLGSAKLLNAIADNLITAYTLYLFLPEADAIPFSRFIALFLIANLTALVSMVPGGIGVMEGMVLLLFKRHASTPELLSSMLMFRLVHYVIPLGVAIVTQTWGRLANSYRPLEMLDPSGKPR